MRGIPAAILCALALAPVFAASPARAASGSVPAAAQSPCAVVGPSRGEGKFTGQIAGEPTGATIEVTSGDQSAVVHYNDAVQVCQGGEPAAASALTRGESVVVYGPMKRNGNVLEMTAARILIAGLPQPSNRASEPVNTRDAGASISASNGGQAVPTGGMQNRTNSQPSNGSKAATDDWSAQGNSQGGSKTQSPGAIACNALLFTVSSPHDSATGQAAGRTSVSGITCKRSVDSQSMQFTQDALTNRALSTLTLSWEGQLEVTLSDAAVSSVQFMSDSGAQVVDVTFAYRKVEIAHLPSNMHVSF